MHLASPRRPASDAGGPLDARTQVGTGRHMSTFIESGYATKADYEASLQMNPAQRAEDEAKVKAGFEKLTTLERYTSIAARRNLGDGRTIPVVGLGLYYTPPGAATYDIVAAALKHGYR